MAQESPKFNSSGDGYFSWCTIHTRLYITGYGCKKCRGKK